MTIFWIDRSTLLNCLFPVKTHCSRLHIFLQIHESKSQIQNFEEVIASQQINKIFSLSKVRTPRGLYSQCLCLA